MRLVSVPYSIRLTDTVGAVTLEEEEVSQFQDWLSDPTDTLNFDMVRKDNTLVRAFWVDKDGALPRHACLQVGFVVLKFFEIETLLRQLDQMWEDLSMASTSFVGKRS